MSTVPAAAALTAARAAAGLAPVLGLDIGGTKLRAAVVDGAGRVLSFRVRPTHTRATAESELAALFELGRLAVEDAKVAWSDLAGIGIGCGGPLDAVAGVLLAPAHLPSWRNVPVTAMAEDALGLPAVLENDATAAAAAEHRYGAGLGTRDLIYLTISTGVGGGIVLDGRLHRGPTGNGGELGHVTVDWHGRPCRGCGRLGCLEAYVSGTSIAERALEALAATPDSSTLRELGVVTAEDVAAAARDGDALARAVWDETVEALAVGLTSIVNLFEPERIVLGGGVTATGEQLLGPVRERVRAAAMTPAGTATDIVRSALGDHVGVVGAATIVYERDDQGGTGRE